jgi:tetratricopeptide (TPR) repeat protein
MRQWLRLATMALCLLAFPALAVSDEVRKYLNSTTQLFENLQYEKALAQLKKAKQKSTGAEDDKMIALYEGVVLSEMGKAEKAEEAFKSALSMDLKARLPFEVSPKVEKSFEKARANVEKLLGPQLAREEEERKKRAAEEARLAEEAKKAEDARLAERERIARENAPPAPPLVEGQSVQKKTTGGDARRFFWLPGVLGLGLAGGGTVALLQARYNYDRLASGNLTPADALTARDTGKTQQTVGWILVGTGSAAVIAAVGMLVFGGPTETTAPTASLVPVEGGGALVLSGQLP